MQYWVATINIWASLWLLVEIKLPCLLLFNDRISERLEGWQEKCLSRACRDVLIKFVLQATPNFAMSYFKLTDDFLYDIDSLIRSFWWGRKKNKLGSSRENM